MEPSFVAPPVPDRARPFGALLGDALRRPGGRRALSVLSLLLALAGIGLFAYPLGTDLYSRIQQGQLDDPTLSSPQQVQAYKERRVKVGDSLTRIKIPKIGVDVVVVEGTTPAALRAGAGHYPESPLPGEVGNVAIAGHRTTFGRPFNRLDELVPGDVVELETPIGIYTYKAVGDFNGHGNPWVVAADRLRRRRHDRRQAHAHPDDVPPQGQRPPAADHAVRDGVAEGRAAAEGLGVTTARRLGAAALVGATASLALAGPAFADGAITAPSGGTVFVQDSTVSITARVDGRPVRPTTELRLTDPLGGQRTVATAEPSLAPSDLAYDLATSCPVYADAPCAGTPALNGTWTVTLSGGGEDTRTFVLRIPPRAPELKDAEVATARDVVVTWAAGREPDLTGYSIVDGSGVEVAAAPLTDCEGGTCRHTVSYATDGPRDETVAVRSVRRQCPDCSDALVSESSAATTVSRPAPSAASAQSEPGRQRRADRLRRGERVPERRRTDRGGPRPGRGPGVPAVRRLGRRPAARAARQRDGVERAGAAHRARARACNTFAPTLPFADQVVP